VRSVEMFTVRKSSHTLLHKGVGFDATAVLSMKEIGKSSSKDRFDLFHSGAEGAGSRSVQVQRGAAGLVLRWYAQGGVDF
jgi:hypothetical protein